jgi:hypothetical protein
LTPQASCLPYSVKTVRNPLLRIPSTSWFRTAVRFHRFSAEKRRVKVFLPGTCPCKNYPKAKTSCLEVFDAAGFLLAVFG